MDPKSELLVFNRKEIIVIIVLLILVALFSFTLGLRLGKSLGSGADAAKIEQAPLAEKATGEKTAGDAHGQVPSILDDAPAPGEKGRAANGKGQAGSDAAQKAEDLADSEFSSEATKEKIGTTKPVPMTLPKEKKTEAEESAERYTLQVGAYRTVGEASEQVAALKSKDLEAFYVEAKLRGKGTWYRVGIGIFPSKELAEKAAAEMKLSKQMPEFIVQKITE